MRLSLIVAVLLAGLLVLGCGSDGSDGAPGVSTGMLRGTVTNASSGAAIPGAIVTISPAVPGSPLIADASGAYDIEVPVGVYDVTCEATHCVTQQKSASTLAGLPSVLDFGMDPVAPVVLNITGLPAAVGPGDSFTLAGAFTVMDGSTVTGYQWTQTASAAATIASPTAPTTNITLGNVAAYRAELLSHLELQDRFVVLGFDPHVLEEAGHVAFQLAVMTTSGTYTKTIDVHAELPFAAVSLGLRAVPVGVPVMLSGKDQATYDWSWVDQPGGSSADFDNPNIRTPSFVPDMPGTYTIQVTDLSGPLTVTLEVIAGTWQGAVEAVDGSGLPLAPNCTTCHNDAIAPDKFTPWRESGHAHIFSTQLNTSTHYGENCFGCHTVGFDKGAANGGFDEATNYDLFLQAGLINSPDPSNWLTVAGSFPAVAQLANIQCENCHGPQNGGAHVQGDGARISYSADVCGTCHGEPLRHARFQQWEESAHANFEVAIAESRNSCAKCHTAQGFVAWVPALTDNDPGNDNSTPSVNLSAEEVQPITCVVCHDPHDVGTTSGDGTNAKMRIYNDTPVLAAGYKVLSVGKGAICMVCHNSRRGLRNDSVWAGIGDRDRAPHGPTQTDVLVGRNAYFVSVAQRGPHSLIEDSCVKCHLQLTDPPAELSYNLAGTNHTFEASLDICSECHGAFEPTAIEDLIETLADDLRAEIETGYHTEIANQLLAGNWVEVTGLDAEDEDVGNDLTVVITDIADVQNVHFSESHGRQAMDITIAGQTVYHVQLDGDTEVFVAGSDPHVVVGSLVDSPWGQLLARAGWNFLLIENDGSHGIHNPAWAIEVLEAAINALD